MEIPAKMQLVAKTIALAVGVVYFVAAVGTSADAQQAQARAPITSPTVSEAVAPLEPIAPTARDGTRGEGFLRKPPGPGPFPAVVLIHGGITRQPTARLREYALGSWSSRFLAAGYVIAAITYRSRDVDLQSTDSVEDALAAIDYVRRLSYVDRNSIVVNGPSGGGDLALAVAAETDIAVIVPEEPASPVFTGVFNKQSPKKGDRYTTADAAPILANPKNYYTEEYQKLTREKIARIRCPILIVQGDQHPLYRFNGEILIPELRAAGKTLEVLTYPGEPHSFAFYSIPSRTPRPEVALKAFQDISAFLQRRLSTQPVPINPRLVKQVPFGTL